MKTNSDDDKVMDLDNYFDKGVDELKNSINNDSKKNNTILNYILVYTQYLKL